jgi:hypothetical protein
VNQFKFGNNHELQKTNILLVRKFRRDLTEAGIELPGVMLAQSSDWPAGRVLALSGQVW